MLRVASVVATVFALFVAVGSFVVTACAEETATSQSSGSCERAEDPQPAAPSSAVEVPDYAADAEDASDPREQAQLAAWKEYQQSLFDALSQSSDPRDWALASLLHRIEFYLEPTGKEATSAYALLERAVHAAPDDVLVQWIAARTPSATDAPSPLATSAAQRLKQLEPNNAAFLLDELGTATRAKDAAAIDKVLARMSSHTGYDEHFIDILKLALTAYRRNPVPVAYWQFATAQEKNMPPEAIAFVGAIAISTGAAMPAYQHLVEACRLEPVSRANANRAADCGTLGHLLIARGGSLVANRIGYAVLRVSRAYTDEDVVAARRDDWVYAQYMSLINADDAFATAEAIAVYEKDWFETGNEFETIRRRLVRAGIALEPPGDWVDEKGTFSAEHLRADAARFEKNPHPSGSH